MVWRRIESIAISSEAPHHKAFLELLNLPLPHSQRAAEKRTDEGRHISRNSVGRVKQNSPARTRHFHSCLAEVKVRVPWMCMLSRSFLFIDTNSATHNQLSLLSLPTNHRVFIFMHPSRNINWPTYLLSTLTRRIIDISLNMQTHVNETNQSTPANLKTFRFDFR